MNLFQINLVYLWKKYKNHPIMKYIFIAISILFTLTPLHSQMEFEEVLSTAQFGEDSYYFDINFLSDTVLLSMVNLSVERDVEYFIYNKDSLINITSKLVRNFKPSNKDYYDTLGFFHQKLSQFVRYEKSDTTIYFIDMNGDIVRKIKYPHNNQDFGKLFMNSNDERFIGIYHRYEQSLTDTYYHDIVYSTDFGESWVQINPEQFIYEQTGTLYNTHRAIDAFFSSKNNGKMLIRFYWSSKFEDYFEYTFYDYNTQEFKIFDDWFNPEYILCFECHLDDYITINNSTSSVLAVKNGIENFNFINLYDVSNLDQDSLLGIGSSLRLPNSTEINKQNYFINSLNSSHHILKLFLYGENPERLYFQSFDSGKSWDYLFKDSNNNNSALFAINQFDNKLWISKRIRNDEDVNYDYSKIYRSISPLTNVRNQKKELGISLFFEQNRLIIKSDEEFIDSNVGIYNIEGKLLLNRHLILSKGNNFLQIPELHNGLILVAIKTKNGDKVFKLLNTN